MLQAGREACSPVQLLQLLHEDWYPEDEAAALAAQARAKVLSPFSRIAAIAQRWWGGGRMVIARRLALLLLLLLVSIALFRFRRGGIVRALQLLLWYKRR